MLKLTQIKNLGLQKPLGHNPHNHLSAASGLVKIGKWLFVVADDEKHLVVFDSSDNSAGIAHRIMLGDLPLDSEARKKHKHDFEAITLVPASKKSPEGGLLILGSGSKKQREQGVLVPFLSAVTDTQTPELGETQLLDLDPIYDALKDEPGKTNIEGAIIQGKHIVLFQRGNKNNRNAIIKFNWKDFLAAALGEKKPRLNYNIHHFDLGELDAVPLCFTDATALSDGRLLFTAAAENNEDAYRDGACLGSAIGLISNTYQLISITRADKPVKLEGIAVDEEASTLKLWLVSDPDNAQLPGELYVAQLNA
ncbi:MAG: hypothetical protein U1F46_02950 [Marinagarivorans sp.]